MRDGFVLKNGKNYSLSLKGEQLAKGDREDFPRYKREKPTRKTRRKITNGLIRYWIKHKTEGRINQLTDLKKQITFLILWMAGNGVTFETVRSKNRVFGRMSLTPYTPVNGVIHDTVKGVAVNDFDSNRTVSLINYVHLSEFKFERPIIEGCIKELESQGILQPRPIYNPEIRRNEMRYQVRDSYQLLQNLIEDLFPILDYILKRKKLEWQQRSIDKDELKRLEFMFSRRIKDNVRSYYQHVKEAKNNYNIAEQIRLLDTKINEMRKNNFVKYHDVKDIYPYDFMLRHTYSQL
jgi:hypothetical protein